MSKQPIMVIPLEELTRKYVGDKGRICDVTCAIRIFDDDVQFALTTKDPIEEQYRTEYFCTYREINSYYYFLTSS